jgi:hypothetical protein
MAALASRKTWGIAHAVGVAQAIEVQARLLHDSTQKAIP